MIYVIMRVIDCTTFNGEHELFDIRYNILSPFIDELRVIEFDKTFSGKPKESTFNQNWPKVKHYFVTEDIWSKYWEEAKLSPNTEFGKGAEHWVREWCQKESIKDCLTDLKDDDIVFIGDCDEIWDPQQFKSLTLYPAKIKLRVYSYWLNNRSTEEFWGTIVAQYRDIKDQCLNHLRTNLTKTAYDLGWHFTSMGGYENVKKKLTDSYTSDSYASQEVLNNLEKNINDSLDFLGRKFSYRVDTSEWPDFLKSNEAKYKLLLKD